jgi:WD40 repeat protein/mono/diheme cytochrome c family protein
MLMMKRIAYRVAFLLFFFSLDSALWNTEALGDDEAAKPIAVSYARDIEPILRTNCQGCHQPAKAQGDFAMVDFADLLKAGESGDIAVVPGKTEESHLLAQITPVNGTAAMPKKGNPLNEAEIELIRRWIAEGAVNDSVRTAPKFDSEHPPVYSRPPVVTALSYSPDGKWLAVSGFQEVLLVNAESLVTEKRLVGLSERIESLSFSPDSKRLAVTGGSPGRLGEVQVWDVESGELTLSHQVTFDTLYGGCFSRDGKLVGFGASDNVVRAIDAETGEKKLHQGAHEDWVLACVFNPSGTHLMSAGRDMTVKLTEVETERFVDNITSITPGALRGGISSLASHNERDEILVGGSDGTPKIYRIFRETARVIGDDANLIRQFPAMKGRIFSLTISSDGSRFAAASTLDGKSEIHVYPYDYVGEVPENVKAAIDKPAGERNDEEKKLVASHHRKTSDAISKVELPAASLYAIAFDAAGKVVATGGSDGVIRLVDVESGEIRREFVPVPIVEHAEGESNESRQLLAGNGMPLDSLSVPDVDQELEKLPRNKLLEIAVEPSQISLSTEAEYAQLVVTAVYADGQRVDVTRLAKYSLSEPAADVTATGLVRPLKAGTTELVVDFQANKQAVAINVGDLSAEHAIDFTRDVNPLLSRLGCNAGTCHGAQKGKNGFKLSLRGYDPIEDIRALSDDLRARRLNTAASDASLMLLKPIGTVPHEGGVLMSKDSVHYATLKQWIAAGAPLNTESQKVSSIEVSPSKPVIELEGGWQQFRVVAHYPDGSTRDVTQEAFVETGNAEVCKSHPGGRVQAVRRGEAPILARYEGAYAAATVTVMGDRAGFVAQTDVPSHNTIDELAAVKWNRMKIVPSDLCEDHEFLRRVCLDLTGLPPSAEELRAFLADKRPTRIKRQAKIDELIGSTDYIDHWTNKWADLLQVNSKFLGGDGAKAFRDWIRAAIAENRPYDEFATDILTASGSNKENPAASYYKILRDPDLMMENTTHLFLAIRFNCNKCHDHPFERWTQDQYYQMAAFFAQTGLKEDPESKGAKLGGTAVEGAKPLYEIVFDKEKGEMVHVRTNAEVAAEFPFACDFETAENATRREKLAAWITSKDNPYFAKSFVNRLWGYLNGTGLVEPLDDIRAGNPPTNPELLEHLTSEFIRSDFNIEHVLRLICNSRTYQLSVGTNDWNADDKINYSHATARRLPAEVLYDAVYRVTGAVSDIPGVEPGTRAASLPDVAVQLPDGFLNNLGRPVRESACECERSQGLQLGPVMALVSGPTVGKAISDPLCALPKMADGEMTEEQIVREVYMRVLSREASDKEVAEIIQASKAIESDNEQIIASLAEMEQWWAGERKLLEDKRLARMEETKQMIAARETEIAPEREKLEQERQAKIAAAEEALKKHSESPLALANQYLANDPGDRNWFPLAAHTATASNKAILVPQADRSIVASGNADKGSYTITYRTSLRGIRGFRLEALPQPGIPGDGPGLPPNGNFVITEIELDAAALSKPEEKKRFTIAAGKADFSQATFSPEATFNGQTNDQGGWAVSPNGSIVHWVSYQTKEAIDYEGGVELTFTIHQNHNADAHRLAHFRISVTTDDGELKLGLPEEFAALRATPEAIRAEETVAGLVKYLDKTDARWNELKSAVATAKMPLPADEQLTTLNALAKSLETPTPDAKQLVQLRMDVEASKQQMANPRLTLAQDLTWALINSPAFLFNH